MEESGWRGGGGAVRVADNALFARDDGCPTAMCNKVVQQELRAPDDTRSLSRLSASVSIGLYATG